MKKSTFGPTKVLQKHGLRSADTWTFITANVRIRALMRERRIAPTLTTCRKPRQQHEFRRRCRGVTPVGLRSFCVTPRQRHTIPQHGRGSTYRQRNAVQTKPATSPIIATGQRCFLLGSRPRLATTPTQGAGFMIWKLIKPIGSSMVGTTPGYVRETWALWSNGCLDILRRHW